jgi:hypothetical protein
VHRISWSIVPTVTSIAATEKVAFTLDTNRGVSSQNAGTLVVRV